MADAGKKMTVKVWRPVLIKLKDRLEQACLRRDAYLTKVLTREIEFLDKEVAVANSQASADYVQRCLAQLNRETISLTLPEALCARIDEVCQAKRIVRDAFFNRFFLVLIASSAVIDHLYFDRVEWRQHLWEEIKNDPSSIFGWFDPIQDATDPFWAIRETLAVYELEAGHEEFTDPATGTTTKMEKTHGFLKLPDRIYTQHFEQFQDIDFTGMSCYLPDWKVPSSDAAKDYDRTLDEWAELVESIKRSEGKQ